MCEHYLELEFEQMFLQITEKSACKCKHWICMVLVLVGTLIIFMNIKNKNGFVSNSHPTISEGMNDRWR